MSEKPKINLNPVLLLDAFTPIPESARSDMLEYSGTMDAETGKIIDESKRQMIIRDAEHQGDSMGAAVNTEELKKSYLVYLAYRTNEGDSTSVQQLWADAFTKESIEIYGAPNKSLASELTKDQVASLIHVEASPSVLDRYRAAVSAVGLEGDGEESPEKSDVFGFERSRLAMGEYLQAKYQDVYDAMAIDAHGGLFSPSDIADTFESGLEVLASTNPAWSAWKIDRREDKDSLSVKARDRIIIVGMKRSSATAEQVKGLFAHEILRHALTAVNGATRSEELSTGLAGYTNFEEGMGVFHEYAMTGKLKDELVDRYNDIALALGYTNDGRRVSRSKLLEYALAREELCNELRSEHEKLSTKDLEKKVYAHVNRIYRGTPGTDQVIGIYTKDIAYLEGFMIAGAYIESELAKGKSIEEIMEYITQGRFDPTKPDHTEYVARTSMDQSSNKVEVYRND